MNNTTTEPYMETLVTNKTFSLSGIIARSDKIQKNCHDFMVSDVSSSNFQFRDYDALLAFIPDGGTVEQYPLSQFALSQLGTKLGIPGNYLWKCISTGRFDLAALNINSWVDSCVKNLFIREYNGRIRGILSGKYSTCDTPDILKAIGSAINMSDYQIKGHFLSEERFHLRLVSKHIIPVNGEDLFPCIFIDSSDVGRSMLVVHFGLYKQVCTNGLMISRGSGKLFEQKHIGINLDDFYTGLLTALGEIDTLVERSADLVKACRQRLQYEVSNLAPGDFESILSRVKEQTKLSNEGAEKVITLMRTKYDDSRWGYINSITEVAQDYTLERRLELEKIAGDLLLSA